MTIFNQLQKIQPQSEQSGFKLIYHQVRNVQVFEQALIRFETET